jgi:hypothetical protein
MNRDAVCATCRIEKKLERCFASGASTHAASVFLAERGS